MAVALQLGMRRRLRGKQAAPYPAPDAGRSLAPIGVALAAEQRAADGLLPLPSDARRRHIHWTHCRTWSPDDVQPDQLSRDDFWAHLVRCYSEAYPKAESENGSPLLFGVVCKELHRDAARAEDRSQHHHAATFSAAAVYWRKIAKISHEQYHIKLNAAAHDAYVTMYTYLRSSSAKKPLAELDPAPYFSPLHPQGDELKELLECGARYLQVRAKRHAPPVADPIIRSQFGVLFNWVVDHNLRGALGVEQLKIDALSELKAGRAKLIDFVKKHRSSLRDQLDFCWELVGAGQALARLTKRRVDILLDVATDGAASCANGHGACADVYNDILAYQNKSRIDFQHCLFETLLYGRRKGNVFMVVGGKDTGKTTITDPARLIFKTMPTPQADSFCPLQDARGHEAFLWQDFRYCPGHPRVQEQGLRLDEGTWNRLAEGLPTLIGVAKTDGARGDFVFDDDVAMILTGPSMLTAYKNGVVDESETSQLTCRVKYWMFNRPAPEHRLRGFHPCPLCWSRWLLRGEVQWQAVHGVPPNLFANKVLAALPAWGQSHSSAPEQPSQPQPLPTLASSSSSLLPVVTAPAPHHGSAFFSHLSQLMDWRQQGLLSDAEFLQAKHMLGLS